MNKNIYLRAVIILMIIVVCIFGVIIYKKKNLQSVQPAPFPAHVPLPPPEADSYNTVLTTNHIRVVDTVWPPAVTLETGLFDCTPTGTEITQEGQTTQKTISGKPYCVTVTSEGAAGSTYKTYTYVTQIGKNLGTLTFTLQFVQCMNYDEPEQTTCKLDQSSLNIDKLAYSIFTKKE